MTTSVELPKRRALGKGLESLLPGRSGFTPAPATAPNVAPVPDEGKPREIPVDLIERNPFQTRASVDESALKELSASIAATGVVQPILGRPLADNRFQLIAGERRWLASKMAGKTTVPAILRHVSDEQAMEITIVENLQRTDLNPMEQARAYQRLGLQQAVLLLWLVTTVAVIAIALACNHGGGQGTCTASWATFCTGATSAPHSGPGHSPNIARVRGVTSAAPGRALARLAAGRV